MKKFRSLLFFVIIISMVGCVSKEMKKAKEYMNASMFKEAITLLEIEIQDKPKNAEANFLVGKCYLNIENNEKVEKYFKRAILLDSSYIIIIGDLYFNKALRLYKNNNFNQANKYYETALKYNLTGKDNFVTKLYNYTIDKAATSTGNDIVIQLFELINQLSNKYTEEIANHSYSCASPELFSESFIEKLSMGKFNDVSSFTLSDEDIRYAIENHPDMKFKNNKEDIFNDIKEEVQSINLLFLKSLINDSRLDFTKLKYISYKYDDTEHEGPFKMYEGFTIKFSSDSIIYYLNFELLIKIEDTYKISGDNSYLYDHENNEIISKYTVWREEESKNPPIKKYSEGLSDNKKLKAGFIYVGPVDDAGWTKSHDDGRKELDTLDFMEPTIYVESVPEGADAARVITELAESGCNIIFTTSFGYMYPTLDVAAKYPNVTFLHATGYKTADNYTNYMGKMYQTKYLAGILAGEMSKTGKIGYVAPFPIPEIVRHINAFTLGVLSINPDATVMVTWTNSWFDPIQEKKVAITMIADGCDIITQSTDSAGPQEAAETSGVYSIGHDSDMRMFAPKAHLTAPVWHWGVYYKYVATKVHNGAWTNEPVWWGIETGICDLSPFNESVPQEVQDLVTQKKAEIIADDNIFTGPIYDNGGNLRIEENVALTDNEKLSILWFVRGVKGEIPK